MGVVGIAFTPPGGPTYNFVFDKFLDDNFPRSYADQTNFDISVSGTAILTGPAYQQKRIWAINTVVSVDDAEDFDAMYRDWDEARYTGQAVALGLTDTTLGAAVNAYVVFSTPPTYSKVGPKNVALAFGVTEV